MSQTPEKKDPQEVDFLRAAARPPRREEELRRTVILMFSLVHPAGCLRQFVSWDFFSVLRVRVFA